MKKLYARRLAPTALLLMAAAPLAAETVWLPVVAPQGSDGKPVATRLRISNYEGEALPYASTFLSAEGGAAKALRGTVPSDRSVTFAKAAAGGETGLLQIETAGNTMVDSWIETSRAGRTFITRVPVISEANRAEAGDAVVLNGLDRNSPALGLVNLGAAAASCGVDLLRADGSTLGDRLSLNVPALSLAQAADALAAEPEAASARVSCDAPFYAFAVSVDRATSEVAFATPETEVVAKAKAKVPAKGSIYYTANGMIHLATQQKEKGTFPVPVPRALNLSQVVIDWDVTPGPWNKKLPSGNHALIWLYRGRFRSNTVANVNFFGPSKNYLKNNQNLEMPRGANTNNKVGMTLNQGQQYHFRYVYDANSNRITISVSQNGHVLKTLGMAGSVKGRTLTVPATGMIAEFGHYSGQKGPEVPSWGWAYSNLRIEMIQK